MSYTEDSWLDSLVKHSIFNAEDECRLDILKTQQTRQQADSTIDFLLQHHNRVMATRDTDLFVAIGTQIRVLNLTELKDTWLQEHKKGVVTADKWLHKVSYKILSTPEINYTIEAMECNTIGRLLAVTGHARLVIVCLPRQGFAGPSEPSDTNIVKKKVICRTLSVGTEYYNAKKSEIIKTQWHPLSETRTHIVVLGNDNLLRIFDVSVDLEEPEQWFDLSPAEKPEKQEKSRGFSFVDEEDSGEEDAVSFSLGGASQDQSGWESFTVFYALRNGHMYALCPVIPHRSVIRRGHLDNLACISQVKYEQSKTNNKTLASLFKIHTEWISTLYESAQVGQTNVDSNTLTVSSHAQHVKYPVQRQGPFLISHTQSLDHAIEVVDLLYINVEPVNVLVLALNNGVVQNYILASEIDAQWQMPVKTSSLEWEKNLGYLLAESDFLPRATLYESINLKSPHLPSFQRMTLLTDPLYNDTYYVYHAGGVHAIVMSQWIKQLGKLILDHESNESGNAGQGLQQWLSQKKTSESKLLINSSPFQSGHVPIVGLVLINDIYLSYSLIAITCDYRLVTCELNVRRDHALDQDAHTAIKEQLKTVSHDSKYQPVLPLPAFQPPKQLDSLPKQAKVVIPPEMAGKVVITEETLRFFGKTSQQVRRDTHELKKAANKIDSRLTVQQKEFERQIVALRDLYDRLQAAKSKELIESKQQKLKNLTSKHAQMRLRIDEQLRKLMKTYQPDLSNEEREWIEKLEKLSKEIGGDSGYVARVKSLQDQIQQLSIKSDKPKTSTANINATQLDKVLRTLNEQTGAVTEVKQRLENLSNKLPATVV